MSMFTKVSELEYRTYLGHSENLSGSEDQRTEYPRDVGAVVIYTSVISK